MVLSDLYALDPQDIDRLYDAVVAAPLTISRLARSLPRNRLAFALAALAESGLLEVTIDEDHIRVEPLFAPWNEALVVRRKGGARRRPRARGERPAQKAEEARSEEPSLRDLADELGIEEQTLRRNLHSPSARGDAGTRRR